MDFSYDKSAQLGPDLGATSDSARVYGAYRGSFACFLFITIFQNYFYMFYFTLFYTLNT